jgi:hypothetical protein
MNRLSVSFGETSRDAFFVTALRAAKAPGKKKVAKEKCEKGNSTASHSS